MYLKKGNAKSMLLCTNRSTRLLVNIHASLLRDFPVLRDGIQSLTLSQRSNWSKILGAAMDKPRMSCIKAIGTPLGWNFLVNVW